MRLICRRTSAAQTASEFSRANSASSCRSSSLDIHLVMSAGRKREQIVFNFSRKGAPAGGRTVPLELSRPERKTEMNCRMKFTELILNPIGHGGVGESHFTGVVTFIPFGVAVGEHDILAFA